MIFDVKFGRCLCFLWVDSGSEISGSKDEAVLRDLGARGLLAPLIDYAASPPSSPRNALVMVAAEPHRAQAVSSWSFESAALSSR